MVKDNWPDDSLSARIARCIIRKYIDVAALVDGMYWVVEFKPITMARANTDSSDIQDDRWQWRCRANTGSGDIQGDYWQLQSRANAGNGIQGERRPESRQSLARIKAIAGQNQGNRLPESEQSLAVKSRANAGSCAPG